MDTRSPLHPRMRALLAYIDRPRNAYPISCLPPDAFWRPEENGDTRFCAGGKVLIGTVVGRYNGAQTVSVEAPDHGSLAITALREKDTHSLRRYLVNGLTMGKREP